MITKRKLAAEIERLKNENATLSVILRAYMQSNQKMQDDIDALNASLNVTSKEIERWKDIAYKADERRKREYVRNMASRD